MQIRLCTLEDLEPAVALIRRVIPLMRAQGNLQWDEGYPTAAAFQKDIELHQLWAAEIDGGMAGLAAITTDQEPEYANVGWDINELAVVVHRLAVDSVHHGKGVATALMLQAETIAIQRGISILRVDTNTQNQATQRLFPKLGYALAGETTLGFRSGLRFCCYEKRLPQSP